MFAEYHDELAAGVVILVERENDMHIGAVVTEGLARVAWAAMQLAREGLDHA